MARRGGSSTLTGVDYQLLYTVKRFAEAVTEDSITTLRPEAHLPGQTVAVPDKGEERIIEAPSVDDLTISHHSGPTEYISLKHRAGQPFWTVQQLLSRGIIDDFFQQYQKDASGVLRLLSQSPMDQALRDCLERVPQTTPETLNALGKMPLEVYQKIAEHIRQHYSDAATDDEHLLGFLGQVEVLEQPAEMLTETILLRLQPHTQDAQAALNTLYRYAMRAGKLQLLVTPETIRQELINQHQPFILPPRQEEILGQLEAVGAALNAVPANIGNLPGHHITRSEAVTLADWVQEPLPRAKPEQSKATTASRIVIGGAGVGKTVVLRDIYQELTRRHIPVLALKADRIKGETKGKLLDDIKANGLQFPLKQALAIVASAERPVVVLVDQLDALSMCLGAERGLLTSYTELLNELQQLPHVRFILSCRTFDLRHDPELAPFRAAEQVEIANLTVEQVNEALQAADAGTVEGMDPAVINLLQTPLHLAIYCALDAESRSGEPVTSLQGLYDKLLQQYLLNSKRLPGNVGISQVRKYLYQLADAMFQKQQLTLPRLFWEEEDTDVFNYLNTQAIINLVGASSQQITFFHQTFYEYLFAKQFVAKGQALSDFVLNSGQGLFFRSLIQQVLVFLRGQDPDTYLQQIRQLLDSPACRFHVKLLIAQFLATQALPEAAEIELVRTSIVPNPKLIQPFIETVSHRPWLEFLAEPTLFLHLAAEVGQLEMGQQSSVSNTLLWILARRGPELLFPRMSLLPPGPHLNTWIAKVLDDAGATSAAEFTELFDVAFAGEVSERQQYRYWKILQDQAPIRPNWVSEKVFTQLANAPFDEDHNQRIQHEDYLQAEVFKALWKTNSQIAFGLCSRLLRTWIRRGNHYRVPEILEYTWSRPGYALLLAPHFLDHIDIDERDKEPHSPYGAVLHYTWKYLADPTNLQQPSYAHTVRKWLFSRTDLLVNMALCAASGNASSFAPSLFRLFLKDGWFTRAARSSYVGHFTRKVLPHLWDEITTVQRTQLTEALSAHELIADVGVYTDRQNKRVYFSRHGRDALYNLQVLGQERLKENHPTQAALLAQFARRWGRLVEEEPGPKVRWRSGEPSPAGGWNTEKMAPANWLRALRKYRSKGKPDFWSDEGTYTGLCHHINRLIKDRPADHVGLLTYLLDNNDESIAMLLPELCEADPIMAAPLVESAYERQLLNQEAYRRLKRKTSSKTSDQDQPLAVEFVQHDLETIRQNLNAECNFKLEEEPSKRGARQDLTMAALNTPGASELYNLLTERLPEPEVQEVVELLGTVATEGSLIIRSAAVAHLAMLLRTSLPEARVVGIFEQLVGNDYILLAPGQWSLQYLVWRDTSTIFRLLHEGMAEPAAHETITRILAVQWGHDVPGAHELLQKMWALNPAMIPVTLDQLLIGYGKWKKEAVVFEAMGYFLSTEMTKELVRELDDVFRHLSVNELPSATSLTEQYISTCAPYIEYEHFLLDYLAQCVTQYPETCIRLLALLLLHLNKTYKRYDFKRTILKVLVEAYTRLPHQNSQHPAVQTALDLFDELLQDPTVRNDDLKQVMREVMTS
ncbi:NACHT domain-containing protein [Hymenobacter profundi]|uniref:AAA+ ATPase domain-containing protein n=1 Tax=Hymenobacter profundi TaxID=1982110 RepID=A0ABS6WUM0_9BACT|nr:hypothetical protein [Hymenobacter profundi]MBW3127272.1 hypothetical protein [Hymenobacter profundi]